MNAFKWFAEAMRLWKRGPTTFGLMGFVVLVASIVAEPVPVLGFFVSNVVAPLLACGLIYASLAADREGRPRLVHLVAVFAAPLSAQWAVIAAGLVVLIAESAVAWGLADVNLLVPMASAETPSAKAIAGIYAFGALASMPLTFVPMAALFDGEDVRHAFALSLRAFLMNVPSLLLLAVYSYALLLLGLATMGIGLVLALPWIAAASYAAWKDIFAL